MGFTISRRLSFVEFRSRKASSESSTTVCYDFCNLRFLSKNMLIHQSMPRSKTLSLALLAILLMFCISPVSVLGAQILEQSAENFDSLAHSAAAAREAGHPGDAIPLYQRAVTLRPDWAEGWWYLGTLLYDADHFREAIPAFQRVSELAPQVPDVFNFLGLCEFEVGEYDSALQHLQQGRGTKEDEQLARVASYHLALLMNRSGQSDQALDVLSHDFLQGTPPDQVVFAFGLAFLHVSLLPTEVDASKEALVHSVGQLGVLALQGHADQALDPYTKLIQQNPKIPYLRSAYASALESSGHHQQALEQKKLDPSTKLTPTKSPVNLSVISLYVNNLGRMRFGLPPDPSQKNVVPAYGDLNSSWRQAMELFSQSRYAEAIPVLKSWLAIKNQDGTGWAMLGLSEFETKDYDSALLHLEKGASLGLGGSPESVRLARYRLALLLIRSGRFDRASALLVPDAEGNSMAAQIQFALGLALLHKNVLPEEVLPSDSVLVQSAGEISMLLHQSKYDDAFPKLQQLIQARPSTPMLHYVYGLGLASLSRYDDAIAQFMEESRISPKSEMPYVQRAFVELQLRRPADALASAQRAVALAPKSAEAHYVLGRSFLDSGKWSEASQELQSALRLNPGSPEVHFNLAKAYAKLNRREDAEHERATFARLNEEIEKQRSHQGSQAYGAAHTASELSQTQQAPPTPPQK
jgi:tetratricopeptide (TPR) repeat protein